MYFAITTNPRLNVFQVLYSLCGFVMVAMLERAVLYFWESQGWAKAMAMPLWSRICLGCAGSEQRVYVMWVPNEACMEFNSSLASQMWADMGMTELLGDCWLALGDTFLCWVLLTVSTIWFLNCTILKDLNELDSQLSHPQGPVIYQWITLGELLKSLY